MMKLRKRRALVLAGSALALTVALSGCSAINSFIGGGTADADRDEETGQVTESANIGIFALKVGDCKLESPSGLLEDADVVPCTEEHDEEVYHEITMPDGEFSEEDVDAAGQECVGDAFTNFVGITWEESTLDVYPINPTKDTWEQLNDRVVQCVISDPAGPLTVSLKGAAR
ncbi:septum formation family protein [Microbacterium sp. LWO12-1.2]|uniref:septum formation family protein n=1 Tax=Microbacterium sp. LWO12-1.2 TaxID=3135261 RepID=UPI00342E3D0A